MIRWLKHRLRCWPWSHDWVWPGVTDGPRWCTNCGALDAEPLTYADAEELLLALRSTSDFRGSGAEAKLLAHLGAADAKAAA